MLVRLCPCCELGDGGHANGREGSDTFGFLEAMVGHPETTREKRPSSTPPPIPIRPLELEPSKLAAKLLEINKKRFGPVDALDLTDEVLEDSDSEDLGQDQINALFGN